MPLVTKDTLSEALKFQEDGHFEEAEKLFNQGEHYEQGHDPVEQGKENLKIESVEEVDPDTERPIKKDK